jgi:hypothetical protein
MKIMSVNQKAEYKIFCEPTTSVKIVRWTGYVAMRRKNMTTEFGRHIS